MSTHYIVKRINAKSLGKHTDLIEAIRKIVIDGMLKIEVTGTAQVLRFQKIVSRDIGQGKVFKTFYSRRSEKHWLYIVRLS